MVSYKSRRTGETVEFGGSVSSASSTASRSWKYDSTSLNGHSRYSRNAREFEVDAAFFNASYDAAAYFMALIDEDTHQGIAGILSFNGWSIYGNFASGDTDFIGAGCMSTKLTFHADWPIWFQSVGTWSFPPSSASQSGGIDFPHDYPFDFCPPLSGQKTITVDSLLPCEFELVVYGPAVNPAVTINGVRHEVDCTVPAGSLLFIDSMNAKLGTDGYGSVIFLRGSAGNKTNAYGKQSRTDDVLARVNPGSNVIAWDGTFGFDLTLFETRGIRPWM